MESNNFIFLDNASTTKIDPRVLNAMLPYLKDDYGNPSSLHELGSKASTAVEEARGNVASLIGADKDEIYFTSCGTESNNFALEGLSKALKNRGNHIISINIEHYSVLNKLKQMQKEGWEVSFVEVDRYGFADPEKIKKEIKDSTVLISVMHANNEIGTIQNLKEISKITKENNIVIHSDGVATAGIIPVEVGDLGIDSYSFSAQQMYGPKGIAALYVRSGVKIRPFLIGGTQEKGRRAGTENVSGIVGFGKASEIAKEELKSNMENLTKLRDKLIEGIFKKIKHVRLNGHPQKRLPGNVHISFEYVEGESIVLMLNHKDIAVATGSSCASQALKSSHVCLAIGLEPSVAQGSILFSLGKYNTEEEVEKVLEVLPPIISRLREMSPIYKGD